MNKKGFTLIELLAVIIILTILTFVVSFFVDDIINDSEDDNIKLSVKNYIKAIENNIISSKIINLNVENGSYSVINNGNICLGEYSNQECTGDVLELEIQDGAPISGTVVIENESVIEIIDLNINDTIVSFSNGEIILDDDI